MTINNDLTRARKVLYFLTALVLSAVVIRVFVVDSFTVVGNSMAPTIQSGDHIFVNKLAYAFKDPSRNDIVVGNFRELKGTKAIKRIVAMPNEWVRLEGGLLTVSKERDAVGEIVAHIAEGRSEAEGQGADFYYKLDPYEYFLSGDNEFSSIDSFEMGPVDAYHLDGRVMGVFRLTNLKFVRF